jgi:hypothetical protein
MSQPTSQPKNRGLTVVDSQIDIRLRDQFSHHVKFLSNNQITNVAFESI